MILFFMQLMFSSTSLFALEKRVCGENEVWISAHPRTSYTKSDGTFVSATDVIGHCRTKSRAYDFWSSKIGDGPAKDWPLKNEKAQNWSRSDLEKLIRALSRVSEWLWQENVRIHRYGKSDVSGNPASMAQNDIALYDKAFVDNEMLERYLTHELAHIKYQRMESIEQTAFKMAAGWKKTAGKGGKSTWKNTSARLMSHDSDVSPEEDFANSIEYYIHEPMRMKVKNPNLYNWIAAEYGDKLKSGGKSK